MNAGIIGTGHHADRMAETIRECGDLLTLYAVVSDDVKAAEQFAAKWGAGKSYASPEELLRDECVDFIYVATPVRERYELVKKCLKHQKRCLVEKPFALNSAQTRELLYEAEAKNVLVQEASWLRFLPAARQVKKLLERGVIGRPTELTACVIPEITAISEGENPGERNSALLESWMDFLTVSALLFGTNVSKLKTETEGAGLFEVSYYDGRRAVAMASGEDAGSKECRIRGTEGSLAFGPICNPEYIRRYDREGNLAEEYVPEKQGKERVSQLLAFLEAMAQENLECEGLTHSETLRMVNWLDYLRYKRGVTFPQEQQSDLCIFEGPGIKRYYIMPFRRYWIDCLNCIANTLLDYGYGVPASFYYNNNYSYELTAEETWSGYQYKSLAPVTDSFKILLDVRTNHQRACLSQEKDPIGVIRKALDEDKIVRVAIDLYYWVDSGMHYRHNHVIHYSLVVGYDDNRQELMVFETGDYGYAEFRVPYDRAVEALRANPNNSSISELNREKDMSSLGVDTLKKNVKDIVASIDQVTSNPEELWNVESITEEEAAEIFEIIPTHLYSLQNRSKLNALLCFQADEEQEAVRKIGVQFKEMARQYGALKNLSLKLRMKAKKKERIREMKDRVQELLKKEQGLWMEYVESI